ncbi:MAG: hypothetical protein I3J02_11845 [Prevotella sp.]|nr:hypothetical protein [Prevotella sp.]
MRRRLQLLAFAMLAAAATETMAAEYSYEFNQSVFAAAGIQTLNGINWTLTTDAGYFGYSSVKGQQIGSGNNPGKTIVLSTTDIKGTISRIDVTTSGASSIVGELNITVGGNSFGNAYTLTSTSTLVSFTGSGTGEIKLNYSQTSSKAIYIQAIKIVYAGGDDAGQDTLSIPMVEGISAFNTLPDGTEATLYLSDEIDARVTYVYGNNAYVRDHSGAICFYGFAKVPSMSYNQHIAGYITGQKSTVGNMPVLMASSHTNTDLLVIASPVTEANVEPKVITAAEQTGHYADWVVIKDITMQDSINGTDATGAVKVVNSFRTSQYTMPVAGGHYDISGIVNSTATAGDRLSPVYNIATAREGNPTLMADAEFLPISVATGINAIVVPVQNTSTPIYDLTGRRINSSTMRKGVYILKGKKYVK